MKAYHDLLRLVLDTGTPKEDRTGTGTLCVFGAQARFDLADALSELDAETRCMFDPPCRRSFGGACVACLHVSEVACQRFNSVLDRNLLFGELPTHVLPARTPGTSASAPVATAGTGGAQWTAFWTP